MSPIVLLVACNDGSTADTDGATGSTGDTADTSTPPTGEGSVSLAAYLPSSSTPGGATLLTAVFAEDLGGVVDAASCAVSPYGFCASESPAAPGSSVEVTAFEPDRLSTLTTVDVGDTIGFGTLTAPLNRIDESEYYYEAMPGSTLPDGELRLSLAEGDWGSFDAEDGVVAPTPMVVLEPDPTFDHDLRDLVPLRWTPGTQGEVYLLVTTPAERRWWWLPDDGAFDLDLRSLDLPDRSPVDLLLYRATAGGADVGGRPVDLQVASHQLIRGSWRVGSERTELEALDECSEASAAEGTPPGTYVTDLSGVAADLDPGTAGCTGRAAAGRDGLIPVDLRPDDLLYVGFSDPAGDAVLYVLEDCDREITCLEGSDLTGVGERETLAYLNTGAARRVYVVLDSASANAGTGELDLEVVPSGGDVLQPTCVEAIVQGPVASGSYGGTLEGNTNLIDPPCATDGSGSEGLVQIRLLPSETLTATVTTAGADPVLYLLYNCAVLESCFAQAESETGESESLIYRNDTGFSEFFYLVVDGRAPLGRYALDIAIE